MKNIVYIILILILVIIGIAFYITETDTSMNWKKPSSNTYKNPETGELTTIYKLPLNEKWSLLFIDEKNDKTIDKVLVGYTTKF